MTYQKIKWLFVLLYLLLIITSCGPVHRFTRVKKVPREYSLNYCGEDIKAPRSDLNKEPWIVYSDREKNQTQNNAGGNVKAKDVGYLDPFLVIGTKGDFLQLIKYIPGILNNGKLEYKKAEYYGWIHKSKLLLNQQSVTDISSGRKNKMLVVLSDTVPIIESDKYFVADSIRLFKDIEMNTQTGTVPPFSIVYKFKESTDKSKILVAKKPHITPENVNDEVLGWLDKSLLIDIGTGLHIDLHSIPSDLVQFHLKKDKGLFLSEDIKNENKLPEGVFKSLRFNPVLSYSVKDSRIAFRTNRIMPVLDHSDNFILNVNGENMTYKQFRDVAKELKKINICFVFEGQHRTLEQFPQIVNALQGLQPFFDQPDTIFSFSFNTVMNFDDTDRILRPVSTKLSTDYACLMNYLTEKIRNKQNLKSAKLPRKWSALRKAVDLFDSHSGETNLIVVIGETGFTNEGLDSGLLYKLQKNNCRILGFQIYTDEGDEYNNFVLDIGNMINAYANSMLETKKARLVSPTQIKRNNHYTELTETTNGFRLDFPDNSITQGALFFPPKMEFLPMNLLTNQIDTIIQEIKFDNTLIIESLEQAFKVAGNNRTKYDTLFIQNFGLDVTRIPAKKLITAFYNKTPGWVMPSRIVILDDTLHSKADYHLMLSEKEMNDLKDFIAALSEKEVDYIYRLEQKQKQERQPCDCPDDDLFRKLEEENMILLRNDTAVTESPNTGIQSLGAYANTSNVRKHLLKTHLKLLKDCRLCKMKNSELLLMTLAEAQYRIIGSPTSSDLLNTIRLKDVKDKTTFTDEMLEELIAYYNKMEKEIEKAEQFESNGQTYYWLNRKLLP